MEDKYRETITRQLGFHVMVTENNQMKCARPSVVMTVDGLSGTIIGANVFKPKRTH